VAVAPSLPWIDSPEGGRSPAGASEPGAKGVVPKEPIRAEGLPQSKHGHMLNALTRGRVGRPADTSPSRAVACGGMTRRMTRVRFSGISGDGAD
jgi:hypothetical protein